MKIRAITLKNFGAFQDVHVDLSSVTAAVIRGQNGAGKSTAFIDGVTWVLFGICRIPTDEIMRLGTDEMVGTVQFVLHGQDYRVIRRRSVKTKAGKNDLELQLIGPDSVQPLSGARLVDTEEKICQLLNLDFELLTATGFLVQGQADRFTKSTPGERKVILSQILRLDRYPRFKSAASQAALAVVGQQEVEKDRIQVNEMFASRLEGLYAERGTITMDRLMQQGVLDRLEVTMQDLRAQLVTLQAQQDQAGEVTAKLLTMEQRQWDLQGRQRTLLERQMREQKILANKATIEAKVNEEQELRQGQTQHQGERTGMETHVHDIMAQLTTIRTQISAGAVLEREVRDKNAVLDGAVREYLRTSEGIASTIQADEKAVELLARVPCGAELQGRCQFTLNAVAAQQAIPALKVQLAERATSAEQIAPAIWLSLLASQQRLAEWQQEGWEAQQTALEDKLVQARTSLSACQAYIKENEQALVKIAEFTRLVPELEVATRELQQILADLASVVFDLDTVKGECIALKEKVAEVLTAYSTIVTLKRELSTAEIEASGYRASLEDGAKRLGQLEEQILVGIDAQQRIAQAQKELERLHGELTQYQALVRAYERIPVLIMESAIPMLELETNTMLGRISRSGMQVRIDTQKTLKSRDGLAETLDILVRDVHGERRYEAFSGGERARVDLALRIGLSKLMLHRAGAQLDTLIIDEGFAAVDREGVDLLIEVLPVIAQEFKLLLVVTHDEGLKDALAQQIVVSKGTNGSTIEVLA